ncbi:hypothetical protein [Profundibacterium mesophilum]|uniref:Uncharacterized protein n=1 Tax=Profundibacterium mesophilum KAUST100406-0324 TaxID=1037889 RepID=A0A921NPK3_9RHOB|nr:hypothetical protein [Profundibacterium mesophilum]KAF0674477.1 hypothetical protein PMES_03215 [Profundibacterium mesophilum KAUST100406-0324]
MEIAFHIGAHCTDEDRLLKSLGRNRDQLAGFGIVAPPAGRYRALLRDIATRLRGARANEEMQDALLETILEGADPERLILSNKNFLSAPGQSIAGGRLYHKTHKAAWLRALFPDHPVSFHLAIANPATFVPDLYSQASVQSDLMAFVDGDPAGLSWSDMIARLREACPDAPVTVWCHEDAPLIWPAVLCALTGLPDGLPLNGELDMLRPIMSQEGMGRLRRYMRNRPPKSTEMQRRVAAAFLDKYGIDEEIEVELDLPGWTAQLVAQLTEDYDRDVERIAAMPGVTVLGH